MAKISRYTATEVATKMVNDVYKDRENCIRKKIQTRCEAIAKRQFPKAVLDFVNKWKEYITVTHTLSVACLNNQGKTRCWVTSVLSFDIPSGKSAIDAVGADSDVLNMLNEKLRELRRSKTSLLNDITNTLLDLGTTKRVETEFPTAVPYFAKVEIPSYQSDKPLKCEQLKKTIEAEREKDIQYKP